MMLRNVLLFENTHISKETHLANCKKLHSQNMYQINMQTNRQRKSCLNFKTLTQPRSLVKATKKS